MIHGARPEIRTVSLRKQPRRRTNNGVLSPTNCVRVPKVSAMLDASQEDLAFMAFLKAQGKLAPTNPLERINVKLNAERGNGTELLTP